MFDAAWEVAHAHGASKASVADLARATETTHPREALAVYAPEVEFFATVGGDSAYAQAARLLARMATLRSAAEHAEHIASLKLRFARKRNFMKLLE
ncbi:MAG: hypothetical protein IPK81_01625 [Rhodospirillales bacterium]|nr:MAG: hypothetical protein IPK81_01625 [Rhodospirillales bacterium]